MPATIALADLDAADVRALVAAHKALMLEHSPPESSHALLVDGLKHPSLTVWEMRQDGLLLACGALKALSDGKSGEIKSMHTLAQFRGSGLGGRMLAHITAEARARYYTRLYLETGSQPGFEGARRFYARAGFERCGAFEGYRADPHSVFMVKTLG